MTEQPAARRAASFPEWLTAFAPALASLLIILTYILLNNALVLCGSGGQPAGGCEGDTGDTAALHAGRQAKAESGEAFRCYPVSVGSLLAERKWCGKEFRAAYRQTAPAPPPVPTQTQAGGGNNNINAAPANVVADAATRAEASGSPPPSVNVYVTPQPSPAPQKPSPPTPEERRAGVYPARLSWLFIYAVTLVFAAVTFGVAAYLVKESWGLWRGFKGFVAAGAALAAVAAPSGLLLFRLGEDWAPVLTPLVNQVLRADVEGATFWVPFGNALGLGMAFVIILTACAVLWPARGGPGVAARAGFMRVLLYTGMVLLVMSVLRMGATFRWALAVLSSASSPDDRTVKLIEGLASSVTWAEAGSYTMLLAAVYLPSILVLRRRAEAEQKERAARGGYVLVPRERLGEKQAGVSDSLLEFLPKLAAILAPLLAGSATDLLKGLISIGQ